MSEFVPYYWEARKCTGNDLCYRVILSDYLLCDEGGQPEATMLSYSYIAKEQDGTRPVLAGRGCIQRNPRAYQGIRRYNHAFEQL